MASPPICENCVKGNVIPGTPTGEITHIAPYPSDVYLSSKSTRPTSEGSKKAIVFLTDIFGLPLINCKLMADTLNDRVGVDVYVPDLFNGQPPVTVDQLAAYVPDQAGEPSLSIWNRVKLVGLLLTHIGGVIASRPSVAKERSESFVRALKDKGYSDIGVVGYCYGGGAAGHIASLDVAKTVIIAHPSSIPVDEVRKFRVPTAWLLAEEDSQTPPKRQDEFRKILGEKDVTQPFEIKVYKGTAHGFAARPNLSIPIIKEAYEESMNDTVAWFQKAL